MAVEKMLTFSEFQSNPELKAKFGGDYTKYLDSFAAKLSGTALFDFASQNGGYVPGLSATSIFFSAPNYGSKSVQEKEDKRQAAIEERLSKISDPKLRAQIEAELNSKDMSEAFFDMLIDRYEKKNQEFDEMWAKYQAAKGEAADMKRACERILKEYQYNQSSSARSKYIETEHAYNEADMWADIYLGLAGDIAHRVT